MKSGEHSLQEDHSVPEREIDLEQNEIKRRENTKLRLLEWMRYLKNKGEEAQSIQPVDVSAEKHVITKDPLFGLTATDRPLDIPPDNLDPASSTGTSIKFFVRGVGVGRGRDNGGTPAGSVLSLEYRASSALSKSETSCPISGGLVCTKKHGRTRVSTGIASIGSERKRHQS